MIDNDNKSSACDGAEKATQLSHIVETGDITKESVKELRSRYDQFIHSKYVTVRHHCCLLHKGIPKATHLRLLKRLVSVFFRFQTRRNETLRGWFPASTERSLTAREKWRFDFRAVRSFVNIFRRLCNRFKFLCVLQDVQNKVNRF